MAGGTPMVTSFYNHIMCYAYVFVIILISYQTHKQWNTMCICNFLIVLNEVMKNIGLLSVDVDFPQIGCDNWHCSLMNQTYNNG